MNNKAVRAILGLVADAEHVESVDAYHAELLAALAAVFPCDVAVFNEFEISHRQGALTATCVTAPPLVAGGCDRAGAVR